MPLSSMILLAVAALMLALTVRGYLRDRALNTQHRTWLTIAAIFLTIAVATGLLGQSD